MTSRDITPQRIMTQSQSGRICRVGQGAKRRAHHRLDSVGSNGGHASSFTWRASVCLAAWSSPDDIRVRDPHIAMLMRATTAHKHPAAQGNRIWKGKSFPQPILRDARLRRAPQDEGVYAAKSQNLMVRARRSRASRTMRPRRSRPCAIALLLTWIASNDAIRPLPASGAR
jgi:hypothetical protein